MSSPRGLTGDFPNVRAVLRVVLVVVVVVLTLVLMYLLRRPLTWLFIAAFIAVALSGPINAVASSTSR
jgi:predicted PurR-regulated permease PerM